MLVNPTESFPAKTAHYKSFTLDKNDQALVSPIMLSLGLGAVQKKYNLYSKAEVDSVGAADEWQVHF